MREKWCEFFVWQIHYKYAGIGHIIASEKFPPRGTRIPDNNLFIAPHLCFVHLANQGWQNMGVL